MLQTLTYIMSANIPLPKQTQWAGEYILPTGVGGGDAHLLNSNSTILRVNQRVHIEISDKKSMLIELSEYLSLNNC